eukprot:gene25373-33119_t
MQATFKDFPEESPIRLFFEDALDESIGLFFVYAYCDVLDSNVVQ